MFNQLDPELYEEACRMLAELGYTPSAERAVAEQRLWVALAS